MKFLAIAYYTLIRNLKDWKVILILIVGPLFTIYITGASSDRIAEYNNSTRLKLAYFTEASGSGAQALGAAFEQFTNNDSVKKSFDAQKVSQFDEGYRMARNDDVSAFVVLNEKGIETYSTQTNNPAITLIEGFNRAYRLGRPINNIVQQNAVATPENSMTHLDMWTYFNLIIYLFYGAIISAYDIINERNKNILGRIRSTPIGKYTNIAGKLAGHSASFFICTVFIMVFTAVVYGSNWSGNILNILAAFSLYILFAVGFGMAAALLLKRLPVVVIVIMSLNGLLFNMSGIGWGAGGGNKFIAQINPQYHTVQAVMQSIFHSDSAEIYTSMLKLGIATAAMLLISMMLGRRKRV